MIKVTFWAVLAGCAIAAGTVLEYLVWAMPFLPNKTPESGPYALVRSAVAALVAIALVVKTAELRARYSKMPESLSAGQWRGILVSLVLFVLFIALFLTSPGAFSRLSLEDGIVEWASALLPLLASALLAWRGAGLLLRGLVANTGWRAGALLSCAVILFVLGMEEISWMQHVFGVVTPEGLSGNIQGEINFHNFATNQIGALHKAGGFVVLILLPFLHSVMPERLALAQLSDLVPSRGVAMASAPLAAFNYNGWDSLLFQMTTYLTIAIALYFALRARREGRLAEALLCVATVMLVSAGQLLFLVQGERFVRLWDVTEYKEFFIAFGLAVWAGEVFRRLGAPVRIDALRRSMRA